MCISYQLWLKSFDRFLAKQFDFIPSLVRVFINSYTVGTYMMPRAQ